MIQVASIGYPRIGPKRELKKALEQFWKGDIQEQDLHNVAKNLRKQKISFIWVKGHANNKENERCDVLAVQAADSNNLLIDNWYENNVKNSGSSLF